MYISSDEFALLNNDEKLKIVENLKNNIELQKQKYFNNYKDEIPISFYYPKDKYNNTQTINYLNENNKVNELSSSISSVSSNINEDDNNYNSNLNIIKKAKNNAREIRKELEKFNNNYKYKIHEKKNLKNEEEEKEIKNELNNSETFNEFNFIIDSTTNSYDSTLKQQSNNNNYISDPLNIDYNKNDLENPFNINYKNKLKNNYNPHFLNYNNIGNNFNNLNNNNIQLKKRIKNEDYNFEEKKNDNKTNKYEINDKNFINYNIEVIKNKYNGDISLNSIKKNNYNYDTNDNNNEITIKSKKEKEKEKEKENNEIKLDLKEKFDNEYFLKPYLNKLYLYNKKRNKKNNLNKNMKIKKDLSFNKNTNKNINKDKNKDINININNNKQSRNSSKIIQYKSLNNVNRIKPNNVSNRLYNMYQVIIDKINKKKEEIEKKEMRNCSFIPKINNKSKKIMQKIEQEKNENKTFLERNKKYEKENNNKIEKRKNIEKKYKSMTKPKIFDLMPIYKKSIYRINSYNKDDGYGRLTNIDKKKIKFNDKLKELKECTFKPKINNIINYRNDNWNIKYNTIDILHENKNNYIHKDVEKNDKYDTNFINKPTNIKQSFLLMNSKLGYFYGNDNNHFNNIKKYSRNKLYKNIDNEKSKKEELMEYYNSIFNYNPKMNENSQYINSSKINNTESNINYFNNYKNYQKRPISSSKIEKNKIIYSKSFINIYSNNKSIKPDIYINKKIKNDKYNYENNKEENLQPNNNIIINNLDNYKPIQVKEAEKYIEKSIQDKKINEDRNEKPLIIGKTMNNNNSISFLRPIQKISYYNNNYNHNFVYIKKNVKNNNNFSYSNRNNNIITNSNNNSKLINNRMIIQKLLLEEE